MSPQKQTESFLDDPTPDAPAKKASTPSETPDLSKMKKKPGPKKLYVGEDLVILSCKIRKGTKKQLNRALANSDIFESQGQIVEIALSKFLKSIESD